MGLLSSTVLAWLALSACSDTKRGGVSEDPGMPMPSPKPHRDAAAQPDATDPTSTSSINDASTTGSAGAYASDAGTVTFTQLYIVVLKHSCGPCHTTTGDEGTGVSLGKLDMSTQADAYTNLVNVVAAGSECKNPWGWVRVAPGNPDKSILFQKISPNLLSCGKKMPLDRAALSQAQQAMIGNWIGTGAKND